MALELKIKKKTESKDGKTVTFEDTTGTYDATTNPGGYQAEGGDASGNKKRSEVLLQIEVTYKPSSGDTALVVNDYDQDTAAEWTANLETDGWITAKLKAYDASSPETLLTESTVIHELITSKIKIKLVSLNSDITLKYFDKSSLDDTESEKEWDRIFRNLNGIISNFCAGKRYEAQRIVEKLLKTI